MSLVLILDTDPAIVKVKLMPALVQLAVLELGLTTVLCLSLLVFSKYLVIDITSPILGTMLAFQSAIEK